MLSLSSGTLFLREHDWLSLCTNWYLSGVKINSLPLHLHLFSQEKWVYLRKEERQHLFILSPCSSQMQPFVPASENHKVLTSHASSDLAKPSSFKAQMKLLLLQEAFTAHSRSKLLLYLPDHSLGVNSALFSLLFDFQYGCLCLSNKIMWAFRTENFGYASSTFLWCLAYSR